MKGLIDQERLIYNEERERLEEDIKHAQRVAEAKVRLIRNRLLTLYDGEISSEVSPEELIEKIVSRISRLKRNSDRVLLTRS